MRYVGLVVLYVVVFVLSDCHIDTVLNSNERVELLYYINTVDLPNAVTLGGAYDGGAAGRAMCCSGRLA